MTVALERHSALAHAPGGGTSAVGGPFGRKTGRSVSTAAAARGQWACWTPGFELRVSW